MGASVVNKVAHVRFVCNYLLHLKTCQPLNFIHMFSITVQGWSLLLQVVSVRIHCDLLTLVSGKPASHCFIVHAVTGKLLLIAASQDMLFLECQLLVVASCDVSGMPASLLHWQGNGC